MRTDSGSVVLPGCPIPGSTEWADEIVERRIKQGFVKKQDEPKKAKSKSKSAAKSKKEKE